MAYMYVLMHTTGFMYVDKGRQLYSCSGNIVGNLIKFWQLSPNLLCNSIGGFKFGDLVRDHHMYNNNYVSK